MKKFSKIMAVVLTLAMMFSFAGIAAANESSVHTITINNTDQNVTHSYEAYQVFVGKLDANGEKLSDVVWGSGVDGDALLRALKADSTYGTNFADCTTAADVANVLGAAPFVSTNAEGAAAGAIDAIASIIADNLKATAKTTFTAANTAYTANVTGDGYYFIKDTTTTLKGDNGSDTLSKYLLSVVNNVSITAKDVHLTPDKEIVAGSARVKEGTAAVGDVVTFEVTIPVPDTKKYVDHFVFHMNDTLPEGMTFQGITSAKVGSDDAPYTLQTAEANSDTYANYTAPATAPTAADLVTEPGGQKIKLIFTDFKENAEENEWIGKDLVVTYTAVVNDDADFTPTGNVNEVTFDFSNDPNHDYDGDSFTDNDPKGTTPSSTTKTLLINLEIQKTGDNGSTSALEGAEFEITSSDYNVTLVSGEKYEVSEKGEYYKLKDGSYTTTAPAADGSKDSLYASTTTKYTKTTFTDANTTPGNDNKVTVITGADGKIVLKGLKPGTYSIKETVAPSGYNLDPNTYTIKVNWAYDADAKTGTLTKDDSSSTGVTWDGDSAKASITIDNKSGTQLPSTGGIGTTIFYIAGSMMVIGAAVLMVTRRRMNQN